jgi:parallel beta-helix repeat protein
LPGAVVALTAGLVLATMLVLTSSEASSQLRRAGAPACDRFASPTGKDRWSGTRKRPFTTIPRLTASLRPGQTGCLLRGIYSQDQITVRRGGAEGKPIRIRSAPGTRVQVRGRITILPSASDLVFSGLNLDGRNKINGASPTVLGDRITFQGNDVTNHNTEICFILGSTARGDAAEGTVIDGNRIHNCGKLPPQNQDHGVYVLYARDTVIKNNYIYDNADRGIQLYPDADGTLIENNVIDGNGEGIIFSGDEQSTSDNNTVRDNVISNSDVRSNVEYFYPEGASPGQGNVVSHNCLFGAAKDDIDGEGIAFAAQDNVIADPLFADRGAKNFTLSPNSPCPWAAPKQAPPGAQRY